MKKFLSILLAAMMVLAMASVAFAEEDQTPDYKITISNAVTGHNYEAYQIFAGDYDEGVLSNIVWGSGVDTTKETRDAKTVADSLKSESDAIAFAAEMADKLTSTKVSSTYKDGVYTIDVEDPGYYLVMDKVGSDIDVYTRYIVKVLGVKTLNPKADAPSVTKKVQDINDTTDSAVSDWQDSADHDVGDTVNYKITGTLPSTLGDYETYKYIFHDTMSPGLTYKGDAVVKVLDANDNVKADITSAATITSEASTAASPYNGTKLTVSFEDLKKAYGELEATHKIVVYYTCELNENAVHGAAGNPNKVYLEYENNPNASGEGDTDESTQNTPEDVNIVFTYKVIVNKVDADNKALSGATFKLEKKLKNGSTEEITLVANSDGTTFTASGLDDGTYVLTEQTAPNGYNLLSDPIEFTVTAKHDVLSDSPALTELTGTDLEGGVTFTANLTSGSLSTDIVNQKGATLPETGGIGTTLFYLFGSIMAAGSALILVVRRRAEAEEE